MFKNIQKQLLLKYPLLWNTKFIPMVILGILMNIIYFFIGYYDGTIDFTGEYIYGNNDDEILGFGFILTAIILLIWFWFYAKNNSFKAFYVKSKNALFFEFLQILIIFVLFFNFYVVYKTGIQLHNRSYYSYEETKKRCEILSLAEIFIDGSFESTELDSLKMGMIYKSKAKNDSVFEVCRDNEKIVTKDYVLFDNKKYDKYSLINRSSLKFEINSFRDDSLSLIKLKRDVISNKSAVLNFMSSYLDLIKEHNLHTNLDANSWYNAVVKQPKLKNFALIFPYTYNVEKQKNKDYYINHYDYYYNNDEYVVRDKYIFDENYLNSSNIKYSKFYLEHILLRDKYGKISNAYSYRYFRLTEVLILNCIAFMFAVLLFTFRISKLKKWFISIVIFGILAILFGILANVFRKVDFLFPLLSLAAFIVFWVYLLFIMNRKSDKRFSEIIINICIWSIPMFIPFLFFFADEFYRDYIYVYKPYVRDPIYRMFRENVSLMFSINFIISIVFMFYMSKTIRTWKGISEE